MALWGRTRRAPARRAGVIAPSVRRRPRRRSCPRQQRQRQAKGFSSVVFMSAPAFMLKDMEPCSGLMLRGILRLAGQGPDAVAQRRAAGKSTRARKPGRRACLPGRSRHGGLRRSSGRSPGQPAVLAVALGAVEAVERALRAAAPRRASARPAVSQRMREPGGEYAIALSQVADQQHEIVAMATHLNRRGCMHGERDGFRVGVR